jgi:hypothetical protein
LRQVLLFALTIENAAAPFVQSGITDRGISPRIGNLSLQVRNLFNLIV